MKSKLQDTLKKKRFMGTQPRSTIHVLSMATLCYNGWIWVDETDSVACKA